MIPPTPEDQIILMQRVKKNGIGIWESWQTAAIKAAWNDAQLMKDLEQGKHQELKNRRRLQVKGRHGING